MFNSPRITFPSASAGSTCRRGTQSGNGSALSLSASTLAIAMSSSVAATAVKAGIKRTTRKRRFMTGEDESMDGSGEGQRRQANSITLSYKLETSRQKSKRRN